MTKVKVSINGYGSIGKRVADLVSVQNDMEVIGISKLHPNYETNIAKYRKYPIYTIKKNIELFENSGFEIKGTIEEMISESDIVIDCTPKNVGFTNKKLYLDKNIKAIWQGGEKKEITKKSFNSISNYDQLFGEKYARIVSCNTTGICRLLYPLDNEYNIKESHITIIRRSANIKNINKGPIDSIIMDPIEMPSHHSYDVNSILPNINIITSSIKIPTTFMHLQVINIELKKNTNIENIKKLIYNQPRIKMIDMGIHSTSQIIDYSRDLIRPRNDIWENCIFLKSILYSNNHLYLYQSIDPEAIVIPENIDCIRSMMQLESDKFTSIKKTDESLQRFNQMLF